MPKKLLFISFIFASCVGLPQVPEGVLEIDQMAKILAKIHLQQVVVSRMNLGSSDSSQVAYNQLEKEIFEKAKVDTATYKNSFVFYSMHPKYMSKIYVQVEKELVAMKKQDSTKQRNYKPLR